MLEEVPQDLHELNYAQKILDELGLPRKGNLELIADCISARAKQKRQPLWEAFKFIYRVAILAQERGQKVDRWWFQNGEYLRIEAPEPKFKGTFVKIDREATDKEQSSPEWQEANDKLRGLLKQIADGKYPPKKERKSAEAEKAKLSTWLKEKRDGASPSSDIGTAETAAEKSV